MYIFLCEYIWIFVHVEHFTYVTLWSVKQIDIDSIQQPELQAELQAEGPNWPTVPQGGGSAQFHIFKEHTLTPGWHIITKEHSILDPYLDKIWALKTLDNWITCTSPTKPSLKWRQNMVRKTKKKIGNSRNLSPAVFWWKAVTNVGRGPIMAINFLHKCQCNLKPSSSSWWQFLPSSSWFSKSRTTVDICSSVREEWTF